MFITSIQSVAVDELGIKGQLEYLQVPLFFIYMIPIACKITIFPNT